MTASTTATGNVRLRTTLRERGLTPARFAEKIGVDPKTAERWIATGRTPHPRTAYQAATTLGVDVYYLWPALDRATRAAEPDAETVAHYPSAGAVPDEVWREVIASARQHLDMVLLDPLMVWDLIPDLPALIRARAEAGTWIRLALPDPHREADKVRAGCVDALYGPLAGFARVRLAYHQDAATQTVRADGHMLIAHRLDGTSLSASPVLHLRQVATRPLTGPYLAALEHVMAGATLTTATAHTGRHLALVGA